MAEGVVLESGTHDELVKKEAGHYARLVQAQELREHELPGDDSGGIITEVRKVGQDIYKAGKEGILPGCRNPDSHSFGREFPEQQQKENSPKVEKHYGIFYLFKRIGSLNPAGYTRYIIGTFCAICMFYPLLVSDHAHVFFQRLRSSISRLWDHLG